MRNDYFKKIMTKDGMSSMPGSQIKPNRFIKAQKEEKTPSVIRPKPTDSSGQPFKPTPIGKKAGGRIGFKKGSGRTGVGAMDVKSKISLAKKKKKNKSDLGMQSVIHGLDKNPNITAADPKAKFIAKNKPKTITSVKPTLGLKKTEEYKKKLKQKNKGKK